MMMVWNATHTTSWGDGTAGKSEDDETALGIVTYIMLAGLFFGLAATVEIGQFRSRFKEKKGIVCGLACQFLVVPCLGYASTQIFDLDPIYGVTLIILCSSPGGSYSNWWCSMFNADLALSVAMTTCSTFVAMVMLPINTVLYTKLAYDGEEDVDLDWPALIASLGVTIGGITFGLVMGAKFPAKRSKFNAFGQLSGIGLMIVSAIFSSKKDPIWNREACVSLFVSLLPLVCPLSLATALSQIEYWSGWLAGCGLQELLWCHVPAVRRRDLHLAGRHLAARAADQNIGVATSIAINSFNSVDGAKAAGVPLLYGAVETLLIGIWCLVAWKAGWSLAPRKDSIFRVVSNNYQGTLDAPAAPDEPQQSTDGSGSSNHGAGGEEGAPLSGAPLSGAGTRSQRQHTSSARTGSSASDSGAPPPSPLPAAAALEPEPEPEGAVASELASRSTRERGGSAHTATRAPVVAVSSSVDGRVDVGVGESSSEEQSLVSSRAAKLVSLPPRI